MTIRTPENQASQDTLADRDDSSLAARRLKAVELRLQGQTLATIRDAVKLSQPTIISAHKAFLAGGWDAVNNRPRGRIAGSTALGADEDSLLSELMGCQADQFDPASSLWSAKLLQAWLQQDHDIEITRKTANRYLSRWGFEVPKPNPQSSQKTSTGEDAAVKKTTKTDLHFHAAINYRGKQTLIIASDQRGQLLWQGYPQSLNQHILIDFLERLRLHVKRAFHISLDTVDAERLPALLQWLSDNHCRFNRSPANNCKGQQTSRTAKQQEAIKDPTAHRTQIQGSTTPMNQASQQSQEPVLDDQTGNKTTASLSVPAAAEASNDAAHKQDESAAPAFQPLSHLDRLEAQSIHIIREVMACADNPVMLYSIGKDSAVMLHLARKAFYPAPPPFPLLHVDTTWKFREMYEFRDRIAQDYGFELLTHTNQTGVSQGVNPITHGSQLHTSIMKTEALKQALENYGFDAAFGGARRDEEKSRAKERIFSFRSQQHRWDPKNQRPELWNLYNTRKQKGESVRVFPLSNWTELDVWQYIHRENIPVVPLYFAAKRPVVDRDGMLVMVDDDRLPLNEGEVPMIRNVRFRTLGCYPLTGAVESSASTVPEVIEEMLVSNTSERSGRMIDHDSAASMEQKKQEGYF